MTGNSHAVKTGCMFPCCLTHSKQNCPSGE